VGTIGELLELIAAQGIHPDIRRFLRARAGKDQGLIVGGKGNPTYQFDRQGQLPGFLPGFQVK
jgi:hypothetical protein